MWSTVGRMVWKFHAVQFISSSHERQRFYAEIQEMLSCKMDIRSCFLIPHRLFSYFKLAQASKHDRKRLRFYESRSPSFYLNCSLNSNLVERNRRKRGAHFQEFYRMNKKLLLTYKGLRSTETKLHQSIKFCLFLVRLLAINSLN